MKQKPNHKKSQGAKARAQKPGRKNPQHTHTKQVRKLTEKNTNKKTHKKEEKKTSTEKSKDRESKDIQCNIKAKQRIQRKKGGEK